MNIVFLEASQGQNKTLAGQIETAAVELDMQCIRSDLVDLNLPLFSIAEEAYIVRIRPIEKLGKAMKAADGLVVVSPEYNGGVPPSLVNAIAWLSRMDLNFEGVKDWRACFVNKPTLIATASGGSGIRLLTALRIQLSYLGSHVLARDISLVRSSDIETDIKVAVNELHRLCLGLSRNSVEQA